MTRSIKAWAWHPAVEGGALRDRVRQWRAGLVRSHTVFGSCRTKSPSTRRVIVALFRLDFVEPDRASADARPFIFAAILEHLDLDCVAFRANEVDEFLSRLLRRTGFELHLEIDREFPRLHAPSLTRS